MTYFLIFEKSLKQVRKSQREYECDYALNELSQSYGGKAHTAFGQEGIILQHNRQPSEGYNRGAERDSYMAQLALRAYD